MAWGIRKDLELLLDLDLIEERGSRRRHPGEYRSAHSSNAEGGEDVMTFGRTTPILRILDEAKAREFYVEFLGFTVDWEHRFEPDTPLYMQVSKDQCVLHLSEHYGDGTPGVAVRIDTSDIDAFHRELANKRYKYARPGIQDQPWGTREVSVKDPFGNRLTFTMQSAREVGT